MNINTMINDLKGRLLHNIGHKHLYSFFDEVHQTLLELQNIPSSTSRKIFDLANELLEESINYSFYKIYSIKCYECAVKLNEIIKDSFIDEKIKYAYCNHSPEEILAFSFLNYDQRNYIWITKLNKTEIFIEKLKNEKHYELIKAIINILLKNSNQGRRPWTSEDEYNLTKLLTVGIDLLNFYVSETNDIEYFATIQNYFNILYLQSEYENLIKSIEVESTFDKKYISELKKKSDALEKTIDLQLDFYFLYVERNTNLFVKKLDEIFIVNLLELFDNEKFFRILNRIATSGTEKSLKIITYYLDDKEKSVRDYALRILDIYYNLGN